MTVRAVDAIAAISVVTSGAVGVSGVYVSVVLDRRGAARRHVEAREARIDELRSVLDDAASTFARSREIVNDMQDKPGGNLKSNQQLISEGEAAVREVQAQEARIAMRLGTHDPLRKTYHDARHNLEAFMWHNWNCLMDPERDFSPGGAAAKMFDAIDAFHAEAAARVGPERGSTPNA